VRTLIVSNRLDQFNGNIGDFASDPSLYFSWLKNASRVQLDRVGAGVIPIPRLGKTNVIIGGGGLLETTLPAFMWGVARIVRNADPQRTVVWGAGLNAHGTTATPPSYLKGLRLVGLRDYLPDEYRWVPCPSVLLPELQQDYKATREAVVYDNWQFPWQVESGLPRMANNRRFASAATKRQAVSEVITFIGSAETVLTSTYHGALWATLLGRKVVLTRPFSSKFDHFRHQPVVLGEGEDWKNAAERAQAYPGVLDEYRTATNAFAEEVRQLFSL
jgi:hypothetical protein